MKCYWMFAGFLLLLSCSGPAQKSSEEKARDMTRELLEEARYQDSVESAEMDTLSVDSIK